MKNTESMIEKLERSAASERQLDNVAAAEVFEARAEKLRQKYHLPRPEPAKEQVKPEVQRRENYSDNFPGVPRPEAPLTNAQLAALRNLAASAGRPLTDRERAAVLGQKIEDAPKGESKCDRYFEV
jgi:hypothetical protein